MWVTPWKSENPDRFYDPVTPYYVSVAYDQGSKELVSYHLETSLPNDYPIDLPHIPKPAYNITTDMKILILTLILSFVFFSIAAYHRRKKRLEQKKYSESLDRFSDSSKMDLSDKEPQHRIDFLFAIPAIILCSIFVLFLEGFIAGYLTSQVSLISIVQQSKPLGQEIIQLDGSVFTPYWSLIYAFMISLLSFAMRTLVAYVVGSLILRFSSVDELEHNKFSLRVYFSLSHAENRRFLIYCLIVMSIPINTIILVFFQGIAYQISFWLYLVFDIIRMALLILVIPRIHLSQSSLVRIIYLILGSLIAISGVLHLTTASMIAGALFSTIPNDVYETIINAFSYSALIGNSNIGNFASFYIFVFFLTIGIIQILWSLIFFRSTRWIWVYLSIFGSCIVAAFWLVVRVIMPMISLTTGLMEMGYSESLGLVDPILIIGAFIFILQVLFIIISSVLIIHEKWRSINLRWRPSRMKGFLVTRVRRNNTRIVIITLLTILTVAILPYGIIALGSYTIQQIETLPIWRWKDASLSINTSSSSNNAYVLNTAQPSYINQIDSPYGFSSAG